MHERVVERDSDDHSGDEHAVAGLSLDLREELLDLFKKQGCVVVIILEHEHLSCFLVLNSLIYILLGAELVWHSNLMADFFAQLITILRNQTAGYANLESG